jgi:hypothetical protein
MLSSLRFTRHVRTGQASTRCQDTLASGYTTLQIVQRYGTCPRRYSHWWG